MKHVWLAILMCFSGAAFAQDGDEKAGTDKSPFFRTSFAGGVVLSENLTDTTGTAGLGVQGGIHSYLKVNSRFHLITGMHYHQLRSSYTFDRSLALPGPDGLLLTEIRRSHQVLEIPFLLGTDVALGERFRLNIGLGLGAGLLLAADDRFFYENVTPGGTNREVSQDISANLRTAIVFGRGLVGFNYTLSDQWMAGLQWSTGIGLTEISKVDAPGIPNLYFNAGSLVVTRSLR